MRVLFETNVVSELRRPTPDARVVRYVQSIPPEDGYLSVITVGELEYGIKRLEPGEKRTSLEAWLGELVQGYASRVLGIDAETARIWGEIAAIRAAAGRPLQPQDGLIAATALRHGLHLVTRNSGDFEQTGVLTVNPWAG